MKYPRHNGKPQLWLEEDKNCFGDITFTTVRIFYPDGSSEYLSLNEYYDNGDVNLRFNGNWTMSVGDEWIPEVHYERTGDSVFLKSEKITATFLGYL